MLAQSQSGSAASERPSSERSTSDRPNRQRREAMQRQQAEAMSRLSTSRRQQYFAARRDLEKRFASQRLDQLSQAERCIVPARDLAAVETCQTSLQKEVRQQRRQQMADLAELQRRFGLPGLASEGSQKSKQKQGA
jgi:hypothetical protein